MKCLIDENDDGRFNKLIVVQAGSITEAAIDQIFYRARSFTREGVPNVAPDDLARIREKTPDKFNDLIQAAQRYRMFEELGTQIYEDLHRLRQLRNRIHIQFDDKPLQTPRLETTAFSDTEVVWAVRLSEKILRLLETKFRRPASIDSYARSVSFPIL